MSFTIKCNKCGNEQEFKEDDYRVSDNIEIYAHQHGYEGSISNFTIYCENVDCFHSIDIKN